MLRSGDSSLPAPDAPPDHVWDVAILGAGMGGGFAAHALAKAGREVLLLEYGNETLTPPDKKSTKGEQELRLSENRWPTESAYEIDGTIRRSNPPIGAGVGGSANWYAAALERFARIDIAQASGWPISYDELLPYYEQAEKMLHVIGTQDPLGPEKGDHVQPPPPLGPLDEHFARFFESRGLHPYRLHVGIRYQPGCDECLGRLCYKNCRADVRSVLAESVRKPTVMARTEVVKLEASRDKVTHAVVLRNGRQSEIRAKVFVLATGAIHSPKLLLRSGNEYWPDGLANHSGMVGRNLMFHATLNFVLWPERKLPGTGPRKSLSFRDFYEVDGLRCGSVQSTGFEFGYGSLLMQFYDRFDRSKLRRARPARPFLRIPAAVANKISGPGTIFVGIIEDMAYPENRIVLDDREEDGVLIKYTISKELRDRTNRFRELLTERLKDRRLMFLSGDVELNFGHPCGTCVMNDDPAKGVINRDCRAHGIDNLFIADASFMPTSAATNPSLTVAANALRVATKVDQVLAGITTEAAYD